MREASASSSELRQDFDPLPQLWVSLAAAEAALARTDESLHGSLGTGVTARFEFQEVCAWSWNNGQAVHVEDLVLHDEGLDLRMPDTALTRAHGVLRFSREAARLNTSDLLEPASLLRRLGDRRIGARAEASQPSLARRAPAAAAERADPLTAVLRLAHGVTTENDREALRAWYEIAEQLPKAWPAVLRAALLREVWAVIDPLPRRSFVAGLILEAGLKAEGALRRHRLAIEVGARALIYTGRRRHMAETAHARIAWWLDAMRLGAEAAYRERHRLDLALQVAEQHTRGRRTNSRLPALLDLLVRSPLVTAPMASDRLGISQQAARSLFKELGAAVTEITGRQRFKAWRL